MEKLCSIIEKWKLTQYDVKNSGASDAVVKYYRVRKSWEDAKSQLGAYSVFDNAKAMADKHPEYKVYDWNGRAVYGAEVSGGASGMTNAAKTGMYTGVGVFTIMEVKSGKGSDAGWGRLKSGAGWISLDFCEKVL